MLTHCKVHSPVAAETPKNNSNSALNLVPRWRTQLFQRNNWSKRRWGGFVLVRGLASSGVPGVALNSVCHQREDSQCLEVSTGGLDCSFLPRSSHNGTTTHRVRSVEVEWQASEQE